jgi:hypothetical protein
MDSKISGINGTKMNASIAPENTKADAVIHKFLENITTSMFTLRVQKASMDLE